MLRLSVADSLWSFPDPSRLPVFPYFLAMPFENSKDLILLLSLRLLILFHVHWRLHPHVNLSLHGDVNHQTHPYPDLVPAADPVAGVLRAS